MDVRKRLRAKVGHRRRKRSMLKWLVILTVIAVIIALSLGDLRDMEQGIRRIFSSF